ncbi:MAG: hypothetical protein ACTSQP_17170 [Promethearchaeota archaeon]
MAINYGFYWLILEWIIFALMIGPLPIFFFSKYKSDKKAGIESSASFNLSYVLFFLTTAINQLIYIIDAENSYSSTLGVDPILNAGIKNTILIEFTLKSQITIMLCLFFISFAFIMNPIETFLRKSEKKPITILLLVGAVVSGAIWTIFCLLLIPQPLEMILLQIIIALILLTAVFALLISVIAFFYFYLKVAISSTGSVRKKALTVSFGIFFMYFALIGGNLTRPDVRGNPLELIGPIALLIGLLVLLYGFKIESA